MLKDISQCQKLREVQLKEEDRNISFYPKMVNALMRRRLIAKVRVEKKWLIDDVTLRKGFGKFFRSSHRRKVVET